MDSLVRKAGHHQSGLQENILLEVLVEARHRGQVSAVAEGAGWGSGYRNELVNVSGLGAVPGRVACGGAALLGRAGRGRLGHGRGRRSAAFELALVQGLELGLQPVVGLFPFSVLRAQLGDLLVLLCENVFVLPLRGRGRLSQLPDPLGGVPLQIGTAVPIGANKLRLQIGEARHGLVFRWELEPTPVGFREPLEQLADLEVVAGHGADLNHQVLADVFGDGFLRHFGREVVAALGRILVERALEQVQGRVDLALELFPAALEHFALLVHKYAYIYAYIMASKSTCQEAEVRNLLKKRGKALNSYH
jgi:hypothetical protein